MPKKSKSSKSKSSKSKSSKSISSKSKTIKKRKSKTVKKRKSKTVKKREVKTPEKEKSDLDKFQDLSPYHIDPHYRSPALFTNPMFYGTEMIVPHEITTPQAIAMLNTDDSDTNVALHRNLHLHPLEAARRNPGRRLYVTSDTDLRRVLFPKHHKFGGKKTSLIPVKYAPKHLTKKDRKKALKELKKSRKLYKKGKYHTRKKIKSFKSKISPHIKKAMKMYKVNEVKPSKELARKTKCDIKGLHEIVKKGQGAYFSSGSRPNQTGHSWGYARLGSAITGGKSSVVDYHILEKYCKKDSKALKLAKKLKKTYKYGKRGKHIKIGGRKNKTKKKNKFPKKKNKFPKKKNKFPKKKNGYYYFKDYPDFKPNLSPREMFKLGSFGGTYWRPIKSRVVGKELKNVHKKYEKLGWWKDIPDSWLITPYEDYNVDINKYKVKVGTTLVFWEDKGWINKSHPYGWVQWYCDFFIGERSDDDERQIKRWKGVAGERGRFMRFLVTQILKKNKKWNDETVSPKIRQTLQHWAYKLTESDFDYEIKRRKNK